MHCFFLKWQSRVKEPEEGVKFVEFAESIIVKESGIMTPEELAAKTAELEQREQELAKKDVSFSEREASLKTAEADTKTRRIDADLEGLVKDGKLLPGEKEGMASFMAGLSEGETVAFSEAGKAIRLSGPDYLKQFLTGLPNRVDYTERSKDDGDDGVASFAAPPGFTVDAESLAMHNKIQAHADKHNLSFAEAAVAVGD